MWPLSSSLRLHVKHESLPQKTDRLLRAIGSVVVEFQFIESVVAEALARRFGMSDSDDAHRVSAAMSFRQKVELLCDLHAQKPVYERTDLTSDVLRASLGKAEEFRNSVVHSFWYVAGSESAEWHRTKGSLRSKSGFRVTHKTANPSVLEEGHKAMYKIRCWYTSSNEELAAATAHLRRQIEFLGSQSAA
jgi:hypothetical protein